MPLPTLGMTKYIQPKPPADCCAKPRGTTIGAVKQDADIADALSKKHTQGTDTALGAVSTKNPPVDADLAVYRDSTAANVLVTSTWTQIKAFLKTYFDTLYNKYVHPNHSGAVTSVADGAQTITDEAVTYAKMQHISATDKILGRSTAGAGDVEEIACTAAGRALLDDATAAAQATTLGLGTADSPTYVTVKLSGLTDDYMPYHVNDATGLANGPTKTNVDSAVSLKHTQGTDTALGAVGTKNPPIDADLAVYRDSAAANVLVTSTWTQVKAFLKTYFDTLYVAVTGRYRYAAALADGATITLPTITANFPGHGFIHGAHASTGVISESAEFEYGSSGAVQIIRGSANIEANGATAGKISLGPAVAANPVVIKNNLGGGVSVNAMITLWYN